MFTTSLGKGKNIQWPWTLWLITSLLSAIWISWFCHQYFDYGYAYWYDWLNIRDHINEFAPQNYFKLGLDGLTKQQHLALFSDIAYAINHSGDGLQTIRYLLDSGESLVLLREPEIIHLQDVANLVNVINTIGVLLMCISLFISYYLIKKQRIININRLVQQLFMIVVMSLVLVFIIGPTDLFYQLHIWIFPENNQWFFYYQESLMVTLMKAPDLFGAIAATISIFGLVIFILACLLMAYFYSFQPSLSDKNKVIN